MSPAPRVKGLGGLHKNMMVGFSGQENQLVALIPYSDQRLIMFGMRMSDERAVRCSSEHPLPLFHCYLPPQTNSPRIAVMTLDPPEIMKKFDTLWIQAQI